MLDGPEIDEPEVEDKYLTIAEIACRYRFSVVAVWGWIKKGIRKHGVVIKLKAERIGYQYRVTEAAVKEFRRLCNPETWKEAAEEDERERKAARRDSERLRRKLGEGRKRRRPV